MGARPFELVAPPGRHEEAVRRRGSADAETRRIPRAVDDARAHRREEPLAAVETRAWPSPTRVDATRRSPLRPRDVASADEGPRDPRHRNRRARRQRAVRGRLVKAGGPVHRGDRDDPRAVGFRAASPSRATRSSSRCTTPPSTFRRTRGHGPRSGSPPTVRAMLRATGRYADAWFPAAICPPPRLQGVPRRGAHRCIGCGTRSGVDPRRELLLRRHRPEPRRRRPKRLTQSR